MALRLAGVPDEFPLWTGSCPCQPFSVAGQQKGFADERHLWPIWAKLIAQSRPAIVLGEQVAGAAAWLRLVRGDLEAVGYAVGAIPVEAASAGAYHLRDRFWFVAYSESEQARAARQPWQCGDVDDAARLAEREPFGQTDASTNEGQTRRVPVGAGGAGSAGALADDDDDDERLQGRRLQSERTDQQPARPDGMADADGGNPGAERQQRSGEQRLKPEDGSLGWVVGADGKSRCVKSGIRLLAHGVFARASKLRAYGKAIDLRPAAAFIEAALACRP
jgi:DNA (cytosine-5)-methyltransferase 1